MIKFTVFVEFFLSTNQPFNSITFGLFFFQQTIGIKRSTPGIVSNNSVSAVSPTYDLTMEAGVTAERFFDRLALETRLGLVDPGLMTLAVNQSTVYEGATCITGQGLETTRFPAPLPLSVRLQVRPHQIRDLLAVAEGLSGRPAPLSRRGIQVSLADVLQNNSPKQHMILYIKFD